MTYEEAMRLIKEHTDYGGSLDAHGLAVVLSSQEPLYSWLPIKTAPHDGSNILIRFGRDHVSQAKYVAGTLYPWKFIDSNDGVTWVVNHAVEGEYGPSHWMPLPSIVSPVNPEQEKQQ